MIKVKYIISHGISAEDMFCVCFISFGLLLCVHGSNIFEPGDACLTLTNKANCRDSNTSITCTDGLVIITLIVFGDNNKIRECNDCLDPIIDVSGGQNDFFIDYIFGMCLFRQSCSLPLLRGPPNGISIRYRCIPETRIIDPCATNETKSSISVLNIGDTHVFMRRSNQSGACKCVVNGSTEMTIQDFFTIFDRTSEYRSKSVLRFDGIFYDTYNNSNIVHSNIVHTNVSSVSIIFDGIFRRLWLSVNISGNATQIRCGVSATTNFTTALTTITKPTNGTATPSHSITHAATVEPTITTNEKEITVPSIEKTTQPMTQSPDTAAYTSDYLNSTLNIVKESTSLIVYVVSGSAAVVVVVMVVGGIVFLRHRRRTRFMKSTTTANSNPKRERRSSAFDSLGDETSEGQANIENEYACQTVSHITHITKGSVKYAVAVPPGTYNYAFAQYDKGVSQKLRSNAEQTDSSKSDDEEGLCHPYFRLNPINEQGNDTTADERGSRGADGDTITEQPMHIYNHITFGRGASEGDYDSGFVCSDEYAHISIDDVNATGNGRYYNIVNINAGRYEPVDDYCHIGPNNATFHAHVTRDDYNHVVL